METTTLSEKALKNIEYAKNYPLLSFDGLHQPVTVGNISDSGNGRTLINLNCKSLKSGDRNAVYSIPSDWADAKAFKTGDIVVVVVADGWVKKIKPAVIHMVGAKRPVSAARVNQEAALEEKSAEIKSQVDAALENEPAATLSEDEKPF